jgi:hypothetical protein|tara:strand:- start:87 stop:776 length:690 start_codon:yes stop_codon:yes gene_type:complete
MEWSVKHEQCHICGSSDGAMEYVGKKQSPLGVDRNGHRYCFACTKWNNPLLYTTTYDPAKDSYTTINPEKETEKNIPKEPPWKLREEIISRSKSNTWDEAKSEWFFNTVEFANRSNKKTCLCGHYPIVELCHLTNRHTNEDVVVGNVCVTKFMNVEIPISQIIPSLLRIKDNLSNSINDKLLDVVIDKNLINDWEIGFYSDTIRKRKLSFLQERARKRINLKIIKSLII